MTAVTTYYDNRCEFYLNFVEVSRNEFSNSYTARLLKALEMCCRLRFMFFETGSECSTINLQHIPGNVVRDLARKLVRELSSLERDTVEAHLDDPRAWAELISREAAQEMFELSAPIMAQIRSSANDILSASDTSLKAGCDALVASIQELDRSFGARNEKSIQDLALTISTLPTEAIKQ